MFDPYAYQNEQESEFCYQMKDEIQEAKDWLLSLDYEEVPKGHVQKNGSFSFPFLLAMWRKLRTARDRVKLHLHPVTPSIPEFTEREEIELLECFVRHQSGNDPAVWAAKNHKQMMGIQAEKTFAKRFKDLLHGPLTD